MPLKTLVKVGSITNLSEARYCAGMGVDMLGFRVIEGQDNYISSALYQEIRGWISGPKIVAEIYGLTDQTLIDSIVQNYAADYLEMSFPEYKRLKEPGKFPLIVSLNTEDLSHLIDQHPLVSYWIVDEAHISTLNENILFNAILFSVNTKNSLEPILKKQFVKGVSFTASKEISQGFNNYEDLADILESLDE